MYIHFYTNCNLRRDVSVFTLKSIVNIIASNTVNALFLDIFYLCTNRLKRRFDQSSSDTFHFVCLTNHFLGETVLHTFLYYTKRNIKYYFVNNTSLVYVCRRKLLPYNGTILCFSRDSSLYASGKTNVVRHVVYHNTPNHTEDIATEDSFSSSTNMKQRIMSNDLARIGKICWRRKTNRFLYFRGNTNMHTWKIKGQI